MTLSAEKVAILERCYREGTTGRRAAHHAGTGLNAAYASFQQFKARGIPTARTRQQARRFYGWPEPYTGPEWIGKAC